VPKVGILSYLFMAWWLITHLDQLYLYCSSNIVRIIKWKTRNVYEILIGIPELNRQQMRLLVDLEGETGIDDINQTILLHDTA
jgi:hypothetical protein